MSKGTRERLETELTPNLDNEPLPEDDHGRLRRLRPVGVCESETPVVVVVARPRRLGLVFGVTLCTPVVPGVVPNTLVLEVLQILFLCVKTSSSPAVPVCGRLSGQTVRRPHVRPSVSSLRGVAVRLFCGFDLFVCPVVSEPFTGLEFGLPHVAYRLAPVTAAIHLRLPNIKKFDSTV